MKAESKQKLRRLAGGLAAFSGAGLLAFGLFAQRVDAMMLGLAALLVVMAGLIVGLRFRVAVLSSTVEHHSGTTQARLAAQFDDFRRTSLENSGLVLRSFRDIAMAQQEHAVRMRDSGEALASLATSFDHLWSEVTGLRELVGKIETALVDVSRDLDAAPMRTAVALVEVLPERVVEALEIWMAPRMETSEKLMRQLIRDTEGLAPKVAEALDASMAPRVETSEKLMRQLIRDTEGLAPKVAEALDASMAPRVETSEKLMRQLIRDTECLAPKVAEALDASMAPRVETSEKLMRQLIRETDGLAPKVAGALEASMAPKAETSEELLRKLVREVGKLPSLVASGADSFLRSNEKLNDLAHRALAKIQHETMQEAESLIQLHRLFELDMPMPLLGGVAKGWAMEPVTMLALVDEVLRRKPSLIVECGSGTSTVWIAQALRRIGVGSLVALEHLEKFASLGCSMLDAHGLSELAEIRSAPLEACRIGTETFSWYKTSAFEDLADISMLVVDGPPSSTGPLARYPALPLLRSRLLPGALVVIDDVGREDEQRVVQRWQQEDAALVNARMISERTMVFEYRPDGGQAAG